MNWRIAQREEIAITALEEKGLVAIQRDGRVVTVRPDYLQGSPRITDDEMQHVANLQLLEQFRIDGAPISDAGLKHLRGLKNLTDLNITGTAVTDAGLIHLSELKKLERLNLNGTEVSNTGLAHVDGSRTLEYLDVGNTRVTGSGVKHCENLASLSLYGPHITDADLRHLERLERLGELDLHGSDITNAGLRSLTKFKLLEILNLAETSISDEGLRHLAEIRTLKFLDLESTDVTDAGLEMLRHLNLGALNIRNTRVSQRGVAQVKKRLPNATILYRTRTDVQNLNGKSPVRRQENETTMLKFPEFEFVDTFGKLSEKDLQELEATLQVTLPQDYREFLKQANGGVFVDPIAFNPIEGKRTLPYLGSFYAWGDQVWRSRRIRREVYDDPNLPNDVILFAHLSGGGLLGIDVSKDTFGKVYGLFKQDEPESYLVAHSFREFWHNLTIDENEAQQRARKHPLYEALRAGDYNPIDKYLADGGSIDQQDRDGHTLLMMAVVRPSAVRYLLKRNPDPNICDKVGQTAVHHAVQYGNFDSLQLLIEHGGDPFVRDSNGKLPIDLSRGFRKRQFLEKLMDRE